MNNVTTLPETAEATVSSALAPASGEPRPITVRRIRQVDPDGPAAPVIRLPPKRAAALPSAGGQPEAVPPRTGSGANEDSADAQRITGIARSIAQAALEVLGGTRPVQQMARWLDPRSYERLVLRSNMVREMQQQAGSGRQQSGSRLHRNAVVRSTRICRISAIAYEATLVVAERDRVRAVALRLELRRGLWKVTALEIG